MQSVFEKKSGRNKKSKMWKKIMKNAKIAEEETDTISPMPDES